MSVGKKLTYWGGSKKPQRKYRIVCVDEKYRIVKEIKTKIKTYGSSYYIRYNAQYFWVYEWEGREARYAIMLNHPTNDIQ